MKRTMENKPLVEQDEIAKRAKQIWEREGRQAGRDLEYWLRAEQELLSSRKRAENHQAKSAE